MYSKFMYKLFTYNFINIKNSIAFRPSPFLEYFTCNYAPLHLSKRYMLYYYIFPFFGLSYAITHRTTTVQQQQQHPALYSNNIITVRFIVYVFYSQTFAVGPRSSEWRGAWQLAAAHLSISCRQPAEVSVHFRFL